MCISQDRGGHHGRLVLPENFESGPERPPPAKRLKVHISTRSNATNGTKTRCKAPRQVVRHNYHDHRRDVCEESEEEKEAPSKMDKTARFPVRLHTILDQAAQNGTEHIISWQPHGRCFMVHKPSVFMEEILPEFFMMHKFASFHRQLNLCKSNGYSGLP